MKVFRKALRLTSITTLVVFWTTSAHADESKPEPAAPPHGTTVDVVSDAPNATLEARTETLSPALPNVFDMGLLSVGHWSHVCVAPCRSTLDPRRAYRIAGDGLVPTSQFSIASSESHVRVDAKMGSSTGRALGAVATGLGAGGILLGGLALGLSPVLASEDVGSEGFRTAVLAGGAGVLAIGAIALGAGLITFLNNGSSARIESATPALSATR